METRPWQRHFDYDVPATLRYPRIGVHQLLSVATGAFPDKAALNFYGTELPKSPVGKILRKVLRAEETAKRKAHA